ncbi:hypothetical protein [Deinococcus hohokamensis]|uniref:Uncharacterized protein n=1 Tax=Deinococcus hohokamensis TaxID=309883 RepID=A0ABV9I9Z1_9DEIO
MFGRRVPPHIVFALSLVLAVLCALWAYAAWRAGSLIWAGVAGVLAIWLAVDAVRAYGWAQEKRRLEAEKRRQNHPGLK